MRKSRLVILPTKCLNHIGFLLLFLSCPVIGDWGRIQPESEASHRAIKIAREGTCGLQRDLTGKHSDALNKKGFNQCLLNDINIELSTPILSVLTPHKKQEKNVNEIKQVRKNVRVAPARNNENNQGRSISRNYQQIQIPIFRSQPLERNVRERKVKTLSLSRIDNVERSVRTQRFTEKKIQNSITGLRRENDNQRILRIKLENKSFSIRRLNEQQGNQKARTRREKNGKKFVTPLEKQQSRNEKNEKSVKKIVLSNAEERDMRGDFNKQVSRLLKRQRHKRHIQTERTETRETNINERSIERLKQTQRQVGNTKRITRENTERIRTKNVRKISENHQQQSKNLRRHSRRVVEAETNQNRRSQNDIRTTETRSERIIETKDFRRNTFRQNASPSRRINRSLIELNKAFENERNRKTNQMIRKSELIYNRQSEILDFSKTIRPNDNHEISEYLSIQKKNETDSKHEELSDGFFNRITIMNYKDTKIGEWTLNCIIGAVAYYLNSKQMKTH